VPPVLLSGDHAAIAAWRRGEALRRTAERRPDLVHPARAVEPGGLAGSVAPLVPADLGELQTLQWACFDPPLREPADQLGDSLAGATAFGLRVGGRLVGSVAARTVGDPEGPEDAATDWYVFLLMVAPDLRGRGIGRWLLAYAEQAAPPSATTYALVTGSDNATSQRLYRKLGYRSRGEVRPGVVRMTRPIRP
jgi:tRNA (guanine37-N1)-methyltransferase